MKSFMIALAMYSRIPVPQFEWKEENMKYSLLFFPMVGGLLGVVQYLFFRLGGYLKWPTGFMASTLTVIPLLVTGGIHMDGYCDTMDALSSWQPKERRLEILKDPHAGAFAVIWCAAYFIMAYGSWQGVNMPQTMCLICLGYVISRAFSGLAVVFFPAAKKEGSLTAFADAAAKGAAGAGLLGWILAAEAAQIIMCPIYGTVLFLGQVLFYVYYYWMSKRKFGGITGDLAGWYLQCSEIMTLIFWGLVQ